jgi:hypothetical protein
MPKTTKAFQAVRPGNVYPDTIAAGEEVEGRLAEIAEAVGAVEAEKTPRKTKAMKAAPENKSEE